MKLTGPLERVLRVLVADPAEPHYGYDLMKAARLPSGTLYPMLARLQQDGLVDSQWEEQRPDAGGRPRRKYYRLTAEGVRVARLELARASAAPSQDTARRGTARARDAGERAVSGTQPLRRIGEMLIRASCRRLPEDQRAERCREWSAELPAIMDDTSIRLPVLRTVRALRYSAGIPRTTRHLRRASGHSARAGTAGWRDGAVPVRPAAPGSRLTIGVIVWLVAHLRGRLAPARLTAPEQLALHPFPGAGRRLRCLLPDRHRSRQSGALPAQVGVGADLPRPVVPEGASSTCPLAGSPGHGQPRPSSAQRP